MQETRATQDKSAEMAISCHGLTRTFGAGHQRVEALRGVDLEIERGEFVVLLGPSGSGKTTLLNIIGGIDTPTAGEITVAGTDLTALNEDGYNRFRRRHVGFIFQFFNLIPTLTAHENIELVQQLLGDDLGADSRDPRAVLEQVGLGERGDHFPGQLSGGEQQRVAVARAVAKGADLMLCDEPTGALDLETGRLILELLREVNQTARRTMLVVTHNAAIAGMADRVLQMRSGEIVGSERNASPVPPAEVTW